MTAPTPQPDHKSQVAGMVFAVLTLDDQFRVAEANPAAENMLGRSARRIIGETLFSLIDFAPAIQKRLRAEPAKLIARSVPIMVAGQEKRINLTLSALDTHPGWFVMTLNDAGQHDDPAGRAADVSLKAPAILAHEIKNPLAAIRGAGQLLARKLDDADRSLTNVISEEVDRIARLLDRMQELGSATQEPVGPVNLHASIRKAIATVKTGGVGLAPIEFVEEFDPSLPPVRANRDQLEQVLINLLTNAVDACKSEAEPVICVKTRFVSGLAANVFRMGASVKVPIEVTIVDNGPGVDAALDDHLFEPFVTSKTNGQGLGLALVKKMVSDMGGRVTHRRDQRAGLTSFRVHLAIATAAKDVANG